MSGLELHPDVMEPSFGSVSEGAEDLLRSQRRSCGYSIGKNKFIQHLLSAYCVPGTALDFMIWSKLLKELERERKKSTITKEVHWPHGPARRV